MALYLHFSHSLWKFALVRKILRQYLDRHSIRAWFNIWYGLGKCSGTVSHTCTCSRLAADISHTFNTLIISKEYIDCMNNLLFKRELALKEDTMWGMNTLVPDYMLGRGYWLVAASLMLGQSTPFTTVHSVQNCETLPKVEFNYSITINWTFMEFFPATKVCIEINNLALFSNNLDLM